MELTRSTPQINTQINEWFVKNTKLYKHEDIKKMQAYLSANKGECHKVSFSSDFVFKYYDYNVCNVRYESIFKIHWKYIVKKFNRYFPRVKTTIHYECPSTIGKNMFHNLYIHDIYITVRRRSEKIHKRFDCVLEYFEYNSHNRIKDDEKHDTVFQMIDRYIVYNEKHKNYHEFMKKTIHEILMLICTAYNDCYSLSKIIFYNNCSDEINKHLKYYTTAFNLLIDFKKTNNIDLREFHDVISPRYDGELISYDEFIDILKNKYDININIINNNNNNSIVTFNIISQIIINTDMNIESGLLTCLKRIYEQAVNILFESQQKIIEFIKESNKKKNNLPYFMSNIIVHHIHKYKFRTNDNNEEDIQKMIDRLSKLLNKK
jgi:hypothetical protein